MPFHSPCFVSILSLSSIWIGNIASCSRLFVCIAEMNDDGPRYYFERRTKEHIYVNADITVRLFFMQDIYFRKE